ncbi:MAG: PSD1 and planctomycete cytochrome C domain-containing protein [Verrucomicrobiota bacterium]
MNHPVANHRRWIGLVALAAWLCGAVALATAQNPVGGAVDFAQDIRPILNKNCVGCHGGVKRAGKISFIHRDSVVAKDAEDEKPIHPGDPDKSEMISRVLSDDEEERMPPPEHGPKLSENEIKLLRDWIRQGAQWKEHWAWVKPVAQPLPKVSQAKWPRQQLDHFVLARLDAEKLKPSREADRAQWLRRVSFDLTGLPPTPEAVKAFAADKSREAHEKVVDRLLASPRFGERWASPWLDVARYADSMGYEKDPLRTVWPYRDWVIRALNEDLPFDQFTIRQLAGDLLPDATLPDQIAATFHRNTQVNTEGGTDDEEFRVTATIDRVNTTWQVWQATTMGCVQCHSHPYEPINHKEFYSALAFFNTTRDWDLKDELPVLRVPVAETNFVPARELDAQITQLRLEEFALTERLANQTQVWQVLAPDTATATRGTKLVITTNTAGETEVSTTGTVASHSAFTIEIPVPPAITRLGALRVEVLLTDPDKARLTPEVGFVFSELRVALADGATTDSDSSTNKDERGLIKLAHCFGDEANPFFEDDATLKANDVGWGAYPRISAARRAVFAPRSVVSLPQGARLKITIRHEYGANDMAATVARRLRFAISESDDWEKFISSAEFQSRRQQLAALKKRRDDIASVVIPAMSEQAATLRRVTAVFDRGNWLNKTEVVVPGVPKLFGELQKSQSRLTSAATIETTDRLALARWLVSPENPLTARVTVNRVWEQLFGIGIVETVEDFGSSGEKPSHPELLDFLALRFQNELGWSLKKLLREMVLSAAYRQDARATPELLTRDPRNRLLAHGPRTRLSAEMVRDHALAVSGLLSEKMFGPPVMPPQPDGIWNVVYSKEEWRESTGEDRHRRALYTLVRRTTGYPSSLTFDQPTREVCVARRLRTNTPLQALVTLNDPVYVESAVALAARMRREGGEDLRKQIARGYELTCGAALDKKSLTALLDLHQRSLSRYEREPELAKKLAPTPADAALALVANTILNLDSALTK